MRQQTRSEPAEKVIQDIRRAMRKQYSAEEKSGQTRGSTDASSSRIG